jgi:hypothetical protein
MTSRRYDENNKKYFLRKVAEGKSKRSSVILTPLPNTILFICWVCEVACQFYSVAISANPTLGA